MLICLLAVGLSSVSAFAQVNSGQMGIPYDVALEGLSEKDLKAKLTEVSQTMALKDRPPATMSFLKKRADEDVERFLQTLRAEGYYEAAVNVEIEEKNEPVLVTFQIQPGPAFPLESVELKMTADEASVRKKLPSVEDLGLKIGEPARAGSIIDAETKITERLKKRGYPFATVKEKRVVVDHRTKAVSVTFLIDAGPRGKFGPTNFVGLQSVDEKFLQGKLPWKQGQRFDADLVTELQTRLTKSELFSLVQITHAESLDARGQLPMTVTVKERKHRTVSVGLRYYTDEGPGAKVSWEHRNLFHAGEQLKFDATVSSIEYSGAASFKKPEFLRNDQSLVISSRLGSDETDAYTSRNLDSTVLVERQIGKTFRLGLGPAFRISRVDDPIEGGEDFSLLSLTTYFNWDTTDNLLDPTRGGRLQVKMNPYMDVVDTDVSFLKALTSYSRYVKLWDRPSLIFASRAAVGFIAGADRDVVPADLRFYAGGGGSIRGYAFQLVGPLDGDTPLGGGSVLELSAELRAKVTEHFGFATFLDGGTAYESAYPDFSESLRWGTGVGLRYFTPFGPLRLDLAVPLNQRQGVDDSFQIYVGLGQAF